MKNTIIILLLISQLSCVNRNQDNNTSVIPDTNKITKERNNVISKIITDSLPSNANDYFRKIKFPYYSIDSLTTKQFNQDRYLRFTSIDDSIFKNKDKYRIYRYISLQDTGKYISVLIYKVGDGENWVGLYTFTPNYQEISSEVLFYPADGDTPHEDFKYETKIINEINGYKKVVFSNDTFKVTHLNIYSLKDTTTNITTNEVGREIVSTYLVSQNGVIKMINEKTTAQDFFKAFWKGIFY